MIFHKLWCSRYNLILRTINFIFAKTIETFDLFLITEVSQNDRYRDVGLSREKGLQKLDLLLKQEFGISYDERNGMFSEHLILLSAVSIMCPNIAHILEIGTYDGRTALLLSRLFPSANIKTIDLPSSEDSFKTSYGRCEMFDDFLINRNETIRGAKNIQFEELNSLQLYNCDQCFDLIWIDGAHGYPTVAMDIINAVRLAEKGAFVLVDDLWTSVSQSDGMYKSIAGFESLTALVQAKVLREFVLFPKRLGGIFNSPRQKKYVGMFRV